MLITFEEINKILLLKKIDITGSLHIGAHECEEINFYNQLGLENKDIIDIRIKNRLKQENIKNIFISEFKKQNFKT